MRELIDAVAAQRPDVICLGGDIFDSVLPDDNTAAFLNGVHGLCPCFYVTGNHEYWGDPDSFARRMALLDELGITRLNGTAETLEINENRVAIGGADDPCAWTYSGLDAENDAHNYRAQVIHAADAAGEGAYRVLLAHRPERFEMYAEYGWDLVLSGHAHGGQWRIPGLLNGLWAPNQGFFPKLAGGEYVSGGTVMIVSRGLARESTRVPRFYNRPELVVVELE